MKRIIFLLALLFSFGAFERVSACSCYTPEPVCEAFGDAKAIFVGEVAEGKAAETFMERLKNNSQTQSFVFSVSQNFLGAEEGKNITVHTGFGFGDCGYYFEKGKKYLVYAYEREGNLYTTICTRTRP